VKNKIMRQDTEKRQGATEEEKAQEARDEDWALFAPGYSSSKDPTVQEIIKSLVESTRDDPKACEALTGLLLL
jgi:hypothetical protein